MKALRLSTNQVKTEQDIRAEAYPSVLPPTISDELLSQHGYARIVERERPTHEPWQTLENSIAMDGGSPIEIFSVVDMPEPERSALALGAYDMAISAHLDAVARSYGYDSVYTMISYAGDNFPKFDIEGRSMKAYRSQVWVIANETAASHAEGDPFPSAQDVVNSLPDFTLLSE